MGIFKNIWNSIFGKSQKQEEFGRGGSIEEPKLKVVHRLQPEPVGNTSKEVLMEGFIEPSILRPKTKSKCKESVSSTVLNKEQQVIQYLLKYGSIDKRTCTEKFGLKRLDNLICELRKKGMNIKNETIELHNELGEKTKVNNYRLVTSDEAN